MPFQRLLLHYDASATSFLGLLNEKAIKGCWFQLDRLGGCGEAEIKLNLSFIDRQQIQLGDWIAFDAELGKRWYFGRVVQRISNSPHGLTLKLIGMSELLNELFPGGFDPNIADRQAPLRAGLSKAFSDDPDFAKESFFFAADAWDLVNELLNRYITSQTPIVKLDSLLEQPSQLNGTLESLKIRGEESIRSLIKELAVRLQNASWGVDSSGQFYFLKTRTSATHHYREGRDLIDLRESLNLDDVYNRVVLTGDYIYDRYKSSGQKARPSFRWRGHYTAPESIQQHGQRRLRIWLPWIRTAADSRAFMQGFFQRYANAAAKYQFTLAGSLELPLPWLSAIELTDRNGSLITTQQPESIRVQFDAIPRFTFSLGAEDPRQLWPEPPHDERWELPEDPPTGYGGSSVDVSFPLTSLPGSSSSPPPGSHSSQTSENPESSQRSSILSFDSSVNHSSHLSSYDSSQNSSDDSIESDHSDERSSNWPFSSLSSTNLTSDHFSSSSVNSSIGPASSSINLSSSLPTDSLSTLQNSSTTPASSLWPGSTQWSDSTLWPGSTEWTSSSLQPPLSSDISEDTSSLDLSGSDAISSLRQSSDVSLEESLDTYGIFTYGWDPFSFSDNSQ